MKLAVIDYGAGNIGSVLNMLKKIGVPAVRAKTEADLDAATHLILPGVGSFDYCVQSFNASGMRPAIEQKMRDAHTPLLGICVGFQMLFEGSAEGQEAGLGWLPGQVVKFDQSRMDPHLKVPHMGWNEVTLKRPHTLFEHNATQRFYFVHSYHPVCTNAAHVIGTSHHGYEFCCAAGTGLISGVQFHPEKSHRFGMSLLKRFATQSGGLTLQEAS